MTFQTESTPPSPVTLIAAVGRNGVIGKDGELPWEIEEDWNHLIDATRYGALICGRHSYEGCMQDTEMCQDRWYFVVSTTLDTEKLPDKVKVFENLEDCFTQALGSGLPVWVLGGERIYGATLERGDYFFLTQIDEDFAGDTHMPDWKPYYQNEVWSSSWRETPHCYRFVLLARHGIRRKLPEPPPHRPVK